MKLQESTIPDVQSTAKRKIYITVIGSSNNISREVYERAVEVGRLLAENDAIIVTGGRTGVMEAVCKGAKEAGGVTIGILPGLTRDEANKYVDIAIPTGMGFARNAINVVAGDAVIVIAGGPGTLSEVGLALAYGKPVIVLAGTGGVADMIAQKGKVGLHKVEVAITPKEAVQKAIKLAYEKISPDV